MAKRFITLMVLIMLAFASIHAYGEEHLKFMGIPLTGTITQFQAKLKAKGVTIDAALNKTVEAGARVFKGSFSGHKANIIVFYDTSSKIVYRTKVMFLSIDEQVLIDKYYYFADLFRQKYTKADINTEINDNGYEATLLFIPATEPNSEYKYVGKIEMYRDYGAYTGELHIDYTDTINSAAINSRNLDDL